MDEIIKLIQSIIDQGSIGSVLLFAFVLFGGAAVTIWIQKQSISRYETQNRLIELNMESADRAYRANLASQEKLITGLEKQHDAIIELNESLQSEIERIKTDQKRFEYDVRQAMHVGVEEIKVALEHVTVREIIEQIPKSFRQDLEDEMRIAMQNAITNVTLQMDNLRGEMVSPDFAQTIATTVGEALAGQVRRRISLFDRSPSTQPVETEDKTSH